jgi:hypothetical protein
MGHPQSVLRIVNGKADSSFTTPELNYVRGPVRSEGHIDFFLEASFGLRQDLGGFAGGRFVIFDKSLRLGGLVGREVVCPAEADGLIQQFCPYDNWA